MQNTTELEVVSVGGGGFPPPPPVAPSAAPPAPPNQISQAPMLPQVSVPVPRPATAPSANPFASSLNEPWSPRPAPSKKAGKGSARRAFSWFLILAVIAGLTYVGVTYGSELMELAKGDEAVDEPAAPLAFPTAVAAPMPVRTATFTVERPDGFNGPQRYEVTTDFDSGVSRVLIDRDGAPDLEVMSVFDGAMIRRVDQPIWYQLDRGVFPVDSEFGRIRWIRTLDELLSPEIRQGATIDRASESTVGTDAVRHLVVSLDPAVLARIANPAPGVPGPDGTAAPAPPGLPAGLTWLPGTDGAEALKIELWIDGSGTVRKSIFPAALGGETITVTSVSSEPWQPLFPTSDVISPLTAAALFDLSI